MIYNYFTEYLHLNAQQHLCRGFSFENMKFLLYPEVKKLRISNIANHRFLENYKNDPRVPGLAQIARMCVLIMHWSHMHIQRHRNCDLLNLHTPFLPPLKKMGHRKYAENITIQSRFSFFILRVV